jgi:hypothetical protein
VSYKFEQEANTVYDYWGIRSIYNSILGVVCIASGGSYERPEPWATTKSSSFSHHS